MKSQTKAVVKKSKSEKLVVTRFGCVTIVSPAPSPMVIRERVAANNRVVRKLPQIFSRPGNQTHAEDRHIPMFRADSEDPNLVVRDFNGVTDRGKFVRGKFVKVAQQSTGQTKN